MNASEEIHPYPGTPPQREQLRREFQKKLEMSLADCIDTLMSVISRRCIVDIFHVDEILHSRFGEYENENKSMSDVILEHYGPDAVKLIDELL